MNDDLITLTTTIVELKSKTFKLEHKVYKGDTLIAEGFEVRAWVKQPEVGSGGKMSAVLIPEEYAAKLKIQKA